MFDQFYVVLLLSDPFELLILWLFWMSLNVDTSVSSVSIANLSLKRLAFVVK